MARRDKPWHRPAFPINPAWLAYNGDSDGSPFASATPLYGISAGLGNPEDEYTEGPAPEVADALDQFMERLSEDERAVLEMHFVAGLPFSVIAFERGWLLPPKPDRGNSPDAVADKRKAHRIASRAARKLRAMIEAEDMDGVIPRPRAAA